MDLELLLKFLVGIVLIIFVLIAFLSAKKDKENNQQIPYWQKLAAIVTVVSPFGVFILALPLLMVGLCSNTSPYPYALQISCPIPLLGEYIKFSTEIASAPFVHLLNIFVFFGLHIVLKMFFRFLLK